MSFDSKFLNREISIHAPRTGSDSPCSKPSLCSKNFNPRSPHGERPAPVLAKVATTVDFNPRSPHGERLNKEREQHASETISIHAPRTGSDAKAADVSRQILISIHAPRTGSDFPGVLRNVAPCDFNPRSPHGERRLRSRTFSLPMSNFNPRSPHGERRIGCLSNLVMGKISIHAPRTGSDERTTLQARRKGRFQSTLPARGATIYALYNRRYTLFQSTLPARGATCGKNAKNLRKILISIHAPRTGSDAPFAAINPPPVGFQSTLPARGATSPCSRPLETGRFQSTLPARGATVTRPTKCTRCEISIHAPRTGSDQRVGTGAQSGNPISIHAPRTGSDTDLRAKFVAQHEFQSTLPARGATHFTKRRIVHGLHISIHAPRTGSDGIERRFFGRVGKFQSTLPARGATDFFMCWTFISFNFNPRSPHGERRLGAEILHCNKTISIHAPRTGSDKPNTTWSA